ncbi:MAG: dihydrolipoamide acetyltransferase family protein [Pseudobdellovibrionaceae bacterium]
MATEVKLPELGEGVTEGELVKWLVKPGDTVKPDQPVAEVMTDKATVEVPTPVGGVVKDLKFKVGDVIAVEKVLLTLEAGGAAATATTNAPAPAAKPAAAPVQTVTTSKPAPPAGASAGVPPSMHEGVAAGASYYPPAADSKVLATPSTRRLAREMNVDINNLTGSGLAGRVTREDVMTKGNGSGGLETYSNTTPMKAPAFPRPGYQGPAGAAEERVAIRGIRKKIAENMQMAKHIIPHFTLMDEAEVTELVQLRESLKDFAEKNNTKITYLPFVMKALIATCRQFPMFNASIDDAAQEIVYKKYFNVGFAADTPNGLVVPVIKNADQKTLLEISQEILDLSKRARDGKLKPDEMKGATITITNIGSVGGTYATPIINHPEVAILGMYKITDKLVMGAGGKVDVVKAMNFTVTADHRLIDGAVAANFLKLFLSKIQKPGMMMLDMM